ncbi:hypothetical protein ACLOJK_036364 [Asimina triloba]
MPTWTLLPPATLDRTIEVIDHDGMMRGGQIGQWHRAESRRAAVASAAGGVAEGGGNGRTQVDGIVGKSSRRCRHRAGGAGFGATQACIGVGAEAGGAGWWTAWITRSRPCRRRR